VCGELNGAGFWSVEAKRNDMFAPPVVEEAKVEEKKPKKKKAPRKTAAKKVKTVTEPK
jgi:hypothetical protein